MPLLVAQAASPQVDVWLSEDPELALWTLTAVEVSSALRRLVREGILGEREANVAESRADELIGTSHVVVNVDAVKVQARRPLGLHAACGECHPTRCRDGVGKRPTDATILLHA